MISRLIHESNEIMESSINYVIADRGGLPKKLQYYIGVGGVSQLGGEGGECLYCLILSDGQY